MPSEPQFQAHSGRHSLDTPTDAFANCIHALSVNAGDAANTGQQVATTDIDDAATILFHNHLKFDFSAPDWPEQDRVVLFNA